MNTILIMVFFPEINRFIFFFFLVGLFKGFGADVENRND